MLRLIVLLTFLISAQRVVFGQLVINEVSAAQNTGYADEDGDFPDWIELYNNSGTPIDLEGYKLRMIDNKDVSWSFPSIVIQPYDHLLVFASEKNRRVVIDHWEVPVYPQLNWSYLSGSAAPAGWNLPTFDASGWNSGMGGIGYGDGDDSTVIAPTTTLYMRSDFTISDTSKISVGLMGIDYDDSFVAYLNGVEFMRNNIGIPGIPPLYTDLAYEEREANLYQGGGPEFYYIDIDLMNEAKKQGINVFSVEIHNVDPLSDDLSSIPYFLIGVTNNVVTYFPYPANIHLHTNFNISSFPARIRLMDPSDDLLDEVIVQGTQLNHSFGRSADGANSFCLFNTPTPDTNNILSNCFSQYAESPVFSLKPGFYSGSQILSMTSVQAGEIRYTIDGSEPTIGSSLYSTPLTISSNTTVRAILFPFGNALLPSKKTVATYFFNENVSLPVISLSTDPENLWDYYTGIYVFGPNADSINYPFIGANFWSGWEKECHVEYFDRSKSLGFSQAAGLKIHGNFSKAWPQKSFRILAKDDYNEKWIDYRLFPEKPYRNRFKNFNIRNAGIDYNTVHFRDALMHRAVAGLNMEHMAYEPCVLFLNGEYWGVYGLRERQDDSYIEENFSNVTKENIDLLRFEGDVLAGSNVDFLEMMEQLNISDLSNDDTFQFFADNHIDIYNVADYFIAETFYCNVDWIYQNGSNNVKYWRSNKPESKWRYVLWDTDLGLGLTDFSGSLGYNYLGAILNPSYTSVHSTLIRKLLENETYARYFINRYADLLNTNFHPNNMEKTARELQADLEPEMTRHFAKWNEGPISIFGFQVARSTNLNEWKANIDTMLMWTALRPQVTRDYIQSMIGSPNQVDITLAADPPEAGVIQINTIVPDSLPWTGRYFNGVPVSISAIANSGYRFHHWESSLSAMNDSSSYSMELNVEMDQSFTAHFTRLEFDINVYPNPSSSGFVVDYILASPTQLSIRLFGIDGKLEREIISHHSIHPEGKYSVQINNSDPELTKGIHLLKCESTEFSKTIKLIVN